MYPASCNRLESLSNELILDIFEYFDAYNLYEAFYGLNHRINSVLQSARLHILYDPSSENKTGWDTLISSVNPSQIRILSCYVDINIDNHFLSSAKENLRSIRLHNTSRQSMNKIFQHFAGDNQIKRLSITERSRFIKRNDHSLFDLILVDNAYRFTSLVNLSLSCNRYRSVSSVGSVQFLQLRHLSIINCCWSTNFLQFLQIFEKQWDKEWVIEQFQRTIKNGNGADGYDLMVIILPSTNSHGHHTASGLLSLEAIDRLQRMKSVNISIPTVIGGSEFILTKSPTYAENGLAEILTNITTFELRFNLKWKMSKSSFVDYKTIRFWVAAEHKSQGSLMDEIIFEYDRNEEQYSYFAINERYGDHGHLSMTRNIFSQLANMHQSDSKN
ncbi:unnamed protein product [Rotaria sp. Silwood1]|nr:unnamed protein product [Rotaria sp. Silwood1]CAF3406022.1 unnamed protein product [Rotaria sp. Silwood1]CAF4546937.1 unnamed protein product [Rotaria sp. Silwood1]